MAETTVPTVTIFDQHDLELIAKRQLKCILTRAKKDDQNFLLLIGRKLVDSEPLTPKEREAMSFTIYGLRLDGIVVIPARLMNHNTGRVQVYEHICREFYKSISAK